MFKKIFLSIFFVLCLTACSSDIQKDQEVQQSQVSIQEPVEITLPEIVVTPENEEKPEIVFPEPEEQEVEESKVPQRVLISNIDPKTNIILCKEYAEIPERTKAKLYDIAVNAGNSRANKILQQSINKLTNAKLSVDGKIGPATLKSLCGLNEQKLLETIANQQLAFYQGIVNRNESQRIFLNGWTRRSKWIPSTEYNYAIR